MALLQIAQRGKTSVGGANLICSGNMERGSQEMT